MKNERLKDIAPFHYVLDKDDNPVALRMWDEEGNFLPANMERWGRFMGSMERVIGQDIVDDYTVSTVFLGFHMPLVPGDRMLLWETMVFAENQAMPYCARYTNASDARDGHRRVVLYMREQRNPPGVRL